VTVTRLVSARLRNWAGYGQMPEIEPLSANPNRAPDEENDADSLTKDSGMAVRGLETRGKYMVLVVRID
jgi:hypothetical protein